MAKQGAKQSNREKREQRKKEKAAAEQADRKAAARRKLQLGATVVITAAVVAAIQISNGPKSLMGIVLLAGAGVALIVGLGGLAGGVKPRDRSKAGNIDYGN